MGVRFKKNWRGRSKFAPSKIFLGADYLEEPREDEHLFIRWQFHCPSERPQLEGKSDGDCLGVFVGYSIEIKSTRSGD